MQIDLGPAAFKSQSLVVNVRVLIDGPSELVFDYALPHGWKVVVGCRVRVPLRHKLATGTVLSISEESEHAQTDFTLRELDSLIDPEPLMNETLLKVGRWIADYYACGFETVVRSLLPESVRNEGNSAKTRRIAVLVKLPNEEELDKISRRAPRQHATLMLLSSAAGQRMATLELGKGADAPLRALQQAGCVRIEKEEVRRDPEADGVMEVLESKPLKLNSSQQAALEAILASVKSNKPKPQLLMGVTGSGKTEVYLQAARKVIDSGRGVLVLVPEISLTPQTVRRFKARFASMQDEVAVLHSHLSQGERFDEWHRIRKGKARIVIGARSAVFAPIRKLGLIIVDEEHENSYKQDSVPRYHGRDVAVLRAAFENSAIVLGSATPSLESWNNAQSGKYELLRLDHRADGQSMPLVRVVDMRVESRKHKGSMPIFSDALRTGLEQRLEKGEQAILFLNRRGFARALSCPKCGHVCECPHCSIALTYHRTDERLICHICGHQAVVPRKCPECKDPAILFQGFGTQKVEEVMAKLMPQARIARIDADAMKRKNALRDILLAFKAHKIDILIGTQMIAKGLHFPNVTLVGILNADIGLHTPDFRAGERTFQLITQVAGRAGRGDLEGEVVVQTATPHSPSIQFARKHDFDGFSEQELEFRQHFGYPPYAHCAVLTSRSTHERRAEFTLQTLHTRLKESLPKGLVLGEVLPSPLLKAHGQFRFQLMLRAGRARTLSSHVQGVLKRTSLPEDVTVVFDMDALSFS
ncbi:MAG: replication restart helicase PriA [Luteolibacter sp.]